MMLSGDVGRFSLHFIVRPHRLVLQVIFQATDANIFLLFKVAHGRMAGEPGENGGRGMGKTALLPFKRRSAGPVSAYSVMLLV